MIWQGPLREDDREQQIQTVEGFTTKGVSGIVLAPLIIALARPRRRSKARRRSDSHHRFGLNSDVRELVATDNRKRWHVGGRPVGPIIKWQRKGLLLRYAEGSASTNEREEGFLSEMKSKFPVSSWFLPINTPAQHATPRSVPPRIF